MGVQMVPQIPSTLFINKPEKKKMVYLKIELNVQQILLLIQGLLVISSAKAINWLDLLSNI